MFLVAAFAPCDPAKADEATVITVSGNFYKGLEKLVDLIGQTHQILRDVQGIKAEKKKPEQKLIWQSVIDDYNEAAKQIADEKIVVDYTTPDRFKTTAAEASACITRETALEKLRGNIKYIGDGFTTLSDLQGKLRIALARADELTVSLNKIEDLAAEISGKMEFNEIAHAYFLASWAEINFKVGPALSKLHRGITDKQKELDRQSDLVGKKLSNLNGNVYDLVHAECDLSGVYGEIFNGKVWHTWTISLVGDAYVCSSEDKSICQVLVVDSKRRKLAYRANNRGFGYTRYDVIFTRDYKTAAVISEFDIKSALVRR